MIKKKKKIENQEQNIVDRDFNRIYIYKRNRILLMPIPYKWELDVKKIAEIKKNK